MPNEIDLFSIYLFAILRCGDLSNTNNDTSAIT